MGRKPQRRMGRRRVEGAWLPSGPAQRAGNRVEQLRQQHRRTAPRRFRPEVVVDRLAQPDEGVAPHRRDGDERGGAVTLGAMQAGGGRKGVHRCRVGIAVDPARRVGPEHDGIGDVQRKRAAGKAMGRPGEGHALILTGKSQFTSYTGFVTRE